MPDAFRPHQHGAFLSFLDFLDEPSQVVKNVLRGNGGAAGRHVANMIGDTVDAFLPGDLIPDMRQEGDDVSSSELVGLDDKEHPFLGGAVNFVGDTLLNPATYIPGTLLAKGAGKVAGIAAKGISKIPGGVKALEKGGGVAAKIGEIVRETTGDTSRWTPRTKEIMQRAQAAKTGATEAGLGHIKGTVLGQLSEQEGNIVADVLDNAAYKKGQMAGHLGPTSEDPMMLLRRHPGVNAQNMDRMRQAVAEAMDLGQEQAMLPNVYAKRTMPDPTVFGATGPQTALKGDYLARTYKGQTAEQAINEALDIAPGQMGSAAPLKARTLPGATEQAEFLNAEKGVEYERNAVKRLAKRADAEGTLAQRSTIGREILGPDFVLADPEMKKQVVENLRGMAASGPEGAENARVLLTGFQGMKERGGAMKVLAGMNGIFKKFAVYGAFIPKFGAASRNAIGGVWQSVAEPATRDVAMAGAKRLISPTTNNTLYGAISDGLEKGFGLKLPKGAISQKLKIVDDAFQASNGSAENAYRLMESAGHGDLAALFRAGISDGFVRSEDLLADMARNPWQKKFNNLMNWPGSIFKGVEDRMRLGAGLDLLEKAKAANIPLAQAAQDAVRATKDAFYDYGITSVKNRNARDIIPFFQFQAKAIPQTARFMAEKPYVATAMASALTNSQGDDPVYPYMEGKLNVPIGADTQGNNQFVSGFGLPFESLANLPNPSDSIQNFGRDLEKNVVAASNPLIKTGFSIASGEDPYFGTPYGSYDKVPMFGNVGAAGRAYNEVAQAGLIQPLAEPLRLLGQLTDERKTAGAKALDLLTGANVVSVDPDKALQQQLTQQLQTNPQIKQYTSFYDQSGDAQTQDLIRAYQAAKKRSKDRRAVASASRP